MLKPFNFKGKGGKYMAIKRSGENNSSFRNHLIDGEGNPYVHSYSFHVLNVLRNVDVKENLLDKKTKDYVDHLVKLSQSLREMTKKFLGRMTMEDFNKIFQGNGGSEGDTYASIMIKILNSQEVVDFFRVGTYKMKKDYEKFQGKLIEKLGSDFKNHIIELASSKEFLDTVVRQIGENLGKKGRVSIGANNKSENSLRNALYEFFKDVISEKRFNQIFLEIV